MKTYPIFNKQFKDLWREKTFVLILLLIFFIIISLSILIAVTAFVYNPEFLLQDNVKVGYVGDFRLEEYSDSIDWFRYQTEQRMAIDFNNGTIDAMITQVESDPYAFNVVLPENPVKNSVISSVLKDMFQAAQDYLLTRQDEITVATPAQFNTQNQTIRGIDTIFEILFGFALPLFLLIPVFLIGNLFIDNISEDFERKNNNVLFTATSPLKYIHEILAVGFATNAALVLILQTMIYLRFSFLSQFFLTFLYVQLFFGVIAQFAIYVSFHFKLKTPAQLTYSFAVLSVFLLSTYISFFPIKAISATMLGINLFNPLFVITAVILNIVLYLLLRRKVNSEYYV